MRLHSRNCSWEKSLNSLALRQQSHTSDTACLKSCKGEGLEMTFFYVDLRVGKYTFGQNHFFLNCPCNSLSFIFLEVKRIYNQGAEDQVLLMSNL